MSAGEFRLSKAPLFHLAFPVDDLKAARQFYSNVLGCRLGRSSDSWIDFEFGGHQIVAHLVERSSDPKTADSATHHSVDHREVPVPHFGLILELEEFHTLATRLRGRSQVFEIEPYCRFAGKRGEQWTMFLRDPAGNALEFKAFARRELIFERDPNSESMA